MSDNGVQASPTVPPGTGPRAGSGASAATRPLPPPPVHRVRPSIVVGLGIGLVGAAVAVMSLWQATHVKPTSLYVPGSGSVVPASPATPSGNN